MVRKKTLQFIVPSIIGIVVALIFLIKVTISNEIELIEMAVWCSTIMIFFLMSIPAFWWLVKHNLYLTTIDVLLKMDNPFTRL